jgi:hypothetical protein
LAISAICEIGSVSYAKRRILDRFKVVGPAASRSGNNHFIITRYI